MGGNGQSEQNAVAQAFERRGWVRVHTPERPPRQRAKDVFYRDKRAVYFGDEFVSTCANSTRADSAVRLLNRIAALDEITLSVVSRGVQVLRGQADGFLRLALTSQAWQRDLAGAILDPETTAENLLGVLRAWAALICKVGPDGLPYESTDGTE